MIFGRAQRRLADAPREDCILVGTRHESVRLGSVHLRNHGSPVNAVEASPEELLKGVDAAVRVDGDVRIFEARQRLEVR